MRAGPLQRSAWRYQTRLRQSPSTSRSVAALHQDSSTCAQCAGRPASASSPPQPSRRPSSRTFPLLRLGLPKLSASPASCQAPAWSRSRLWASRSSWAQHSERAAGWAISDARCFREQAQAWLMIHSCSLSRRRAGRCGPTQSSFSQMLQSCTGSPVAASAFCSGRLALGSRLMPLKRSRQRARLLLVSLARATWQMPCSIPRLCLLPRKPCGTPMLSPRRSRRRRSRSRSQGRRGSCSEPRLLGPFLQTQLPSSVELWAPSARRRETVRGRSSKRQPCLPCATRRDPRMTAATPPSRCAIVPLVFPPMPVLWPLRPRCAAAAFRLEALSRVAGQQPHWALLRPRPSAGRRCSALLSA